MSGALSPAIRALVKLATRILRLVPERYRPYARTTGRLMLDMPATVDGYRFGERFPPSGATTAGDSPPRAGGTGPPNPCEVYFDAHTEGPGIWKWRHYFEIYHRHFAKFVGREVHVLEVGVYSGGSLGMWKHYFGCGCHVYGVDIQEACKAYEDDSVTILVGDQEDRDFWKEVRGKVPALDIVIDDGGHMPHQQIVTLEELLPHLRPGGVYLCEDVYGAFHPFHDYVSGLTHNLNGWEMKPGVTHQHEGIEANPLQREVSSVHLYPFAVVLEKSETPVGEFVAPKHGTQWQPWL
jgi:SAM-dependent methyltransferase